MNEQQRDRWATELLTSTLGVAWHDSDPQARRVADAAALRLGQLLTRIRAARETVGDTPMPIAGAVAVTQLERLLAETPATGGNSPGGKP